MAKKTFKKTRTQREKEEKKALAKAAGPREPPFRNRQRTLIFSSRGIPYRFRHLMSDLLAMLPHAKTDAKLDTRNSLSVTNEICEMKSCNNCLFFEVRGKRDLYLWLAKSPRGPSVKFLVTNVHTMDELKLTGNCLKGSRYVLSFDADFDAQPHLRVIKELFTQALGVPKGHTRSKPFVDHAMSFFHLDGRIWVRHYQIIESDKARKGGGDTAGAAAVADDESGIVLVEIGPRMVLQVVKIFSGSFEGATLYKNEDFQTPAVMRRLAKTASSAKYSNRVEAEEKREKRKAENVLPEDELDDVFRRPEEDDDEEGTDEE